MGFMVPGLLGGGILGKGVKNGNARSPSGKQRVSKTELPMFDLRLLLTFDLWKEDIQFHL